MGHKTIRMMENDAGTYDEVTKRHINRRLATLTAHLEGIDGDEEANTVTYWYASGMKEFCKECFA